MPARRRRARRRRRRRPRRRSSYAWVWQLGSSLRRHDPDQLLTVGGGASPSQPRVTRGSRATDSVPRACETGPDADARRAACAARRRAAVPGRRAAARRPAARRRARARARGGVDVFQLREKDAPRRRAARRARRSRANSATRPARCSIVNDRPDLARRAGADGVHVGQDDMSVAEAREQAARSARRALDAHARQVDAPQRGRRLLRRRPSARDADEARPAGRRPGPRRATRRARRASCRGSRSAASTRRARRRRRRRRAARRRSCARSARPPTPARRGARAARRARRARAAVAPESVGRRSRKRSSRAPAPRRTAGVRARDGCAPARRAAQRGAQRAAAREAAPARAAASTRGARRGRGRRGRARGRERRALGGRREVAGRGAGARRRAALRGDHARRRVGMWNQRYWAVLGFQSLLAITIVVAALSLLVASNVAAVAAVPRRARARRLALLGADPGARAHEGPAPRRRGLTQTAAAPSVSSFTPTTSRTIARMTPLFAATKFLTAASGRSARRPAAR